MRPLPLDFPLETERLRLRIPREEDIPHVFSASRHPGFTDGMLWDPPDDLDALRGPLARALTAWKEAASYQFTSETRDGGAFVGRISLRPSENQIHADDLAGAEIALDVGYWTHPDHQGRGLMTEALSAVVALGFETMGADAIVALHTLWNAVSRRVLEKAGFRQIRVFAGGFVKNGVAQDDALMRIDRTEWLAMRAKGATAP